MTQYGITGENEAANGSSHHIHRLSPKSTSTPVQPSPQMQHSDEPRNSTSRIAETADGSNGSNGGIVQSLLGCMPTMGFMNFLDDWLETQGLKSAGKYMDSLVFGNPHIRFRSRFPVQTAHLQSAKPGNPLTPPNDQATTLGPNSNSMFSELPHHIRVRREVHSDRPLVPPETDDPRGMLRARIKGLTG